MATANSKHLLTSLVTILGLITLFLVHGLLLQQRQSVSNWSTRSWTTQENGSNETPPAFSATTVTNHLVPYVKIVYNDTTSTISNSKESDSITLPSSTASQLQLPDYTSNYNHYDDEPRHEHQFHSHHERNKSPAATISSSHDLSATPWQRTKRPLCTREQVIRGQWVATQLQNGPPYIHQEEQLRCYPLEQYQQRPYPTWKWVPHDASRSTVSLYNSSASCEWTTWRIPTFCHILQGATVLITGDSLSWEHFSSLVLLLGGAAHNSFQLQSKVFQMNIGHAVCHGQTRIVGRRDDRLQNVSGTLLDHEFPPTVLVLNRGAHYQNDTILLTELRRNLDDVRVWLRQCDSYQIKCHFFWRTTVPGHPGCGNFTEPVNDLAAMETIIQDLSNYDNRSLTWHWYDYQHQNNLVLNELEKSGLPYHILDGYYLNTLRPDGHRANEDDCLHSCYPGKMDVYSQLMLHYLRMDRSIHDVHQQVRVMAEQGWLSKINDTTAYDRNATEVAKQIKGH